MSVSMSVCVLEREEEWRQCVALCAVCITRVTCAQRHARYGVITGVSMCMTLHVESCIWWACGDNENRVRECVWSCARTTRGSVFGIPRAAAHAQCVCAPVYVCARTHTHTLMHGRTYARTHAHTHTHAHARTLTRSLTHSHMHKRARARTHARTNMCALTHT